MFDKVAQKNLPNISNGRRRKTFLLKRKQNAQDQFFVYFYDIFHKKKHVTWLIYVLFFVLENKFNRK